jgi:toxin-antitoxin system PIN domain toxin
LSATVDANVLIYASNEADPMFEPARALISRLGAGPDIFYLFWPVVMGYLRMVTHPSILQRPLSFQDAAGNVNALLERPHVRAPGEADGFWRILLLVAGRQVRGNDVPDAHIVSLMRQHGVRTIYSRDRDFHRYEGIEPRNPFQ